MSETNGTVKAIKLVMLGIVGIVGLIVLFTMVKFQTVKGNEYGVLETWTGGVSTNILMPKTHVLFPGFMKHVYVYDGASQVFVMNDKPMAQEKSAAGREKDAYLVQSQEGQDMYVSLNLRWRIDPLSLVSIHTTVRDQIEEKVIRPVVMRVVKDEATTLKAIDAYSGEGLVKLQQAIQNSLTGSEGEGAELKKRGITVENFVIEHIKLDEKYIEEIKGKQIATQKTLRAAEERKAADAEAEVARAKAMAEYNTKLVAQMLLATNMVLQAGADNQKVIIAAKAAAEQVTIAAKAAAEQVIVSAEAQKKQAEMMGEGKKLGMTAEAEGILAMGKAEATAKQLMLDSYKAAGADAYVKVEIAKALSDGTKGIQGYLPNNFNPTVISGNFMDAIMAILNPTPGNLAAPVK